MKRAVRKAERYTADGKPIGGTGQTAIKRRLPPVAWLIERGKIGPDEIRAADEISASFHALAGWLGMRAAVMERVDCQGSNRADQQAAQALGVARYQRWANIWSARAKLSADPMLAVIIAAVVDEQPIRTIAKDTDWHHNTIASGIAAGLRDYAARAGWVTGHLRQEWLEHAEKAFSRRYRRAS